MTELYKFGHLAVKLGDDGVKEAKELLDKVFSHNYSETNQCPDCGSHNIDVDLDCLGDGYVCGSEWCNDCGWTKVTNTFPAPEASK